MNNQPFKVKLVFATSLQHVFSRAQVGTLSKSRYCSKEASAQSEANLCSGPANVPAIGNKASVDHQTTLFLVTPAAHCGVGVRNIPTSMPAVGPMLITFFVECCCKETVITHKSELPALLYCVAADMLCGRWSAGQFFSTATAPAQRYKCFQSV